jgi:hypothetical protein
MKRACSMAVFAALVALPGAGAAESESVFAGLTAHVGRQIQSDKQSFVSAERCTAWFYRQREHTPAAPRIQGVRYRPAADRAAEDCRAQYPGGIEAAREAFGRTQSALSFSLTFFEFALVVDRDDDDRYSARELQDMLESCGLPYEPGVPESRQLGALTAHFDALHRAGGLERLMAGMSMLFDKGYRFSRRDRAVLEKMSG